MRLFGIMLRRTASRLTDWRNQSLISTKEKKRKTRNIKGRRTDKESMKKEKVVIGMSGWSGFFRGGVSLKEAGYDVTGVTMITCDEEQCGQDPSRDAKKVAEEIGIPHYTVDFRKEFKASVMD